MIRINLLGTDKTADPSEVLWVGGFIASVVVFVGVCFFLYQDVSSNLTIAKTNVEDLEAELKQIQETTKEVRGLEKKRKELNDKLAIIARLKKNKLGPVRVMDDLNLGIPDRAWLKEVKETGGLLRLVGYAIDNQTIATFMKDLDRSDYFSSVDLVETKKTKRGDAKIKSFVLQARVNYAGKLIQDAVEEKDVDSDQKKAMISFPSGMVSSSGEWQPANAMSNGQGG